MQPITTLGSPHNAMHSPSSIIIVQVATAAEIKKYLSKVQVLSTVYLN